MTITDETRQKIWRTYGKLPIAFIPNKGQIHQNAHYYAQRSGLGIYFTPQEVLFTFLEKSSSKHSATLIKMKKVSKWNKEGEGCASLYVFVMETLWLGWKEGKKD